MVAINPVCGQLNRGKTEFSLSSFAPESLVSRVRFGRPLPRQPARSPHPGWIWWLHFPFPLSATVSIRTSLRHRASPKFIGSRNCVTDGVHYREPTQVAQQTGASYSGNSMDQLIYAPLFPHPLLVYMVDRSWLMISPVSVSVGDAS